MENNDDSDDNEDSCLTPLESNCISHILLPTDDQKQYHAHKILRRDNENHFLEHFKE